MHCITLTVMLFKGLDGVTYVYTFQYKSDLKNDEEIFVEKTKLIEDCRLQIKELEDERAKLISELEKYLGAGKLQEEQRFRQVNFSLNEQQIKNGAKSRLGS